MLIPGQPGAFVEVWATRIFENRTDANNVRNFCINRTHLITAENWIRKLYQLKLQLIFPQMQPYPRLMVAWKQ